MFTADLLGRTLDAIDCCPWGSVSGRKRPASPRKRQLSLYTPDERQRRDHSPWTVVQGVLAPVQFLVFLISLGLVLNYLATGDGFALATFSIVVKTLVLYTIMITGSIWEREVFGRYLFAPAFYWEDVVSIVVLALHSAYLVALMTNALPAHDMMLLALAAYATYVVNAAQFLLKLRAARREPGVVPAFGMGRTAEVLQ